MYIFDDGSAQEVAAGQGDFSNQGCFVSSLRVARSFELIFKHILRKFRQPETGGDKGRHTD